MYRGEQMKVPHNECTAFNCVLCHAWSPKESRRQDLHRAWHKNLQAMPNERVEGAVQSNKMTLDTLLDQVQPDQPAGVSLVTLPDEAPQLMAHCMGYNEANLRHQLEARALKDDVALSLEDWLALTPYMMLDIDGEVSYEQRGRLMGRFDFDTTRFFLEIWHGYYGVNNALRLRNSMVRIHSVLEGLPSNERRALTFLHETVEAHPDRIVVEEDGSLTVHGESGLHWLILPSHRKVPIVKCKEIGNAVCIQPHGHELECPSGDYPALYAISMLNDLATSLRVHTLSNGLVTELKKARSRVAVPGLPAFNQRREPFQRVFG